MLSLVSVTKRFGAAPPVLHDLSFDVPDGQIVALLGGSGTGKSTILRLIAGLDRPTAGSVRIAGRAVDAPSAAVGFVFQEPRLMPWLDVARNVAFGMSGLARVEREARVTAALDRVGLTHARDRLPKALSGGMAQRTALARALVMEPRVLLLDEPFSALDALLRVDLQDHVLELWAQSGKGPRPTLVLVTHDIEEALRVADRVLVLGQGAGAGGIVADVPVSLPRPRDSYAPEFAALAGQLLTALGRGHRVQRGEEMHPAAAI